LYLAVKHFRHYFEGNPDIIMYCDHEPLVKKKIEINSIFQHAAKIDWHAFAKAQRNDYELKRYLDETNFANVIEEEWNGATLFCDVSSDGTRAGLNESEAPCKFVTAKPPERLAKPSSVSHALVSTLQKHWSKTSKLIQFGSLHFRDSWG